MLKNVYGEVIIPKDSILYHTTDIEYNSNKKTPFLFCSFHPSEWWNLNEIVLRVKLKRDVRLLFMIKDFRKAHINSSLNELSNNSDYLSKLKNTMKYCFREYLLKEDFDGWFLSIDYPLIFNINERYKEKIKEYLDYCSMFGFINDFVFQVILGNAIINYHKYNYEKIDWVCE